MASTTMPRLNSGVWLSRKQRQVRSSGATTSRVALLTRDDVAVPASTSLGQANEIVVTLERGAAPIPEWVLPTAEAFAELLDLQWGWNSYSARPIDPQAVEAAGSLLGAVMEQATPPPAVVPTVHGGVQLEWHRNGLDIEIAINPNRPVMVFASDNRNGEEWEAEWSPGDPSLSSWIHRI